MWKQLRQRLVRVHNEQWLRTRFDENRWYATTVVVAIAIWATPMNPIVHGFIAFFAWIVGCLLFAVSMAWDFCRWHWPFLPLRLQRQIEQGDDIKARRAAGDVEGWRDETLKMVRALWGQESQQYRVFSTLTVTHKPYPLQQLEFMLSMLKGIDPR